MVQELNQDQRLKKLETIFERLVRKSKNQSIKVAVTPFPISACVSGENVRGNILKYMFSAKGTINHCMVRFDRKIQGGVNVDITVKDNLTGSTESFFIDKIVETKTLNMNVKPSDYVIVSVHPINQDDVKSLIKEVYIAMLWTPSLGETDIHKVLLDNLDNDLSEE